MRAAVFQLIRDTLKYARDPLTPNAPYLCTEEETAFFLSAQKENVAPQEALPQKPFPSLPRPQTFKPIPPTSVKAQEPLEPSPAPKNLEDPLIRKKLQKIAPHLALHDTVLEDKSLNSQVLILLCDASTETLDFVKNLARAIDERLRPVKILSALKLEKEEQWDLFFKRIGSNSFSQPIKSPLFPLYPRPPSSSSPLFLITKMRCKRACSGNQYVNDSRNSTSLCRRGRPR